MYLYNYMSVCVHLVDIFEELTTRMHVTENLKKCGNNLSCRHIGEPPVADTKVLVFEIEMAAEKLKKYKTTDIVQVSAELIQAGSRQ